MRLIDADALVKALDKEYDRIEPCEGKSGTHFIQGILAGLIFAKVKASESKQIYDLDEVIRQLESCKSRITETDWAEDEAYKMVIDHAIDIVKKGGKNETN